MAPTDSRETFRFHDFDLDVGAYELRRAGRRIRLERQPMDLLILLVERRRQLVSREEIVERLWGPDVFVDVETGVHTAVRKVRQALRDTPERPAFVETVPGKGYRFIAPVEVVAESEESARMPAAAAPDGASATPPAADEAPFSLAPGEAPVAGTSPWRGRALLAGGMAALVIVLGVMVAWRWRDPGLPVSRVRLAVMPFENLSGDAGRQYLADGLAEETNVWLGRADPDRLAVVGSPSMMSLKRTDKTLSEVAEALSADYLVEGTVRTGQGRLRVTARLIRARDQEQVWSEAFERDASDILAVQQELSASIARQIRVRVSPDRGLALARRQTTSAEAYDVYLRARNFANVRTPAATLRATEYFERATALDPDYALAWSGLAMAHAASPINSDAPPREAWRQARRAIDEAVRIDPGLAEAQYGLGYVDWVFEWNWPAAEAAFRRAVALDPNLPVARSTLGHALSQMGRHAAAQVEMQVAREVDPLFVLPHALSSQVAFQARDYEAAAEHARTAVALDAEFWIGHMMLGQAYAELGEPDLALSALATASRLSRQNSKPVSLTGYILARAGRLAEARAVLAALEATSQQRYVPPYALALVHAGLGEPDAAFAWLERAYAARDVHLMFLVADAKWDPYKDDPRFTALVERCRFTAGNGRPADPAQQARD